jgi:hypothetical protein
MIGRAICIVRHIDRLPQMLPLNEKWVIFRYLPTMTIYCLKKDVKGHMSN